MKTQQEVQDMLVIQIARHDALKKILALLQSVADCEGNNEGVEWILDQLND